MERTFQQAEAQTAIKISTATSASALFSFPNEQTVCPPRSRISELTFAAYVYFYSCMFTSILQELPLLWFYL